MQSLYSTIKKYLNIYTTLKCISFIKYINVTRRYLGTNLSEPFCHYFNHLAPRWVWSDVSQSVHTYKESQSHNYRYRFTTINNANILSTFIVLLFYFSIFNITWRLCLKSVFRSHSVCTIFLRCITCHCFFFDATFLVSFFFLINYI